MSVKFRSTRVYRFKPEEGCRDALVKKCKFLRWLSFPPNIRSARKSIVNCQRYANSSPGSTSLSLLSIALHYEIACNEVARRCTAIIANSLSERCLARSRLFRWSFWRTSWRTGLVSADTRLLKVDLLSAHRSPFVSLSLRSVRCQFIRILGFNYFPFLALLIKRGNYSVPVMIYSSPSFPPI